MATSLQSGPDAVGRSLLTVYSGMATATLILNRIRLCGVRLPQDTVEHLREASNTIGAILDQLEADAVPKGGQ